MQTPAPDHPGRFQPWFAQLAKHAYSSTGEDNDVQDKATLHRKAVHGTANPCEFASGQHDAVHAMPDSPALATKTHG